MSSRPDALTAQVDALLDRLPDVHAPGADVEGIAAILDQAHDVLVAALETLNHPAAPRPPHPAAPTDRPRPQWPTGPGR